MCRPTREFTAESFELEGRLLQTVVPVLTRPLTPAATPGSPPSPSTVRFESVTDVQGYVSSPVQVVAQQAGEATVTLTRPDTAGALQVRVKTDASSPFVGVNVGAVDQTVTFGDGQGRAAVTVPILSGAPNPGVVDVGLSADPINPPTPAAGDPSTSVMPFATLDLKVVASEPTLPPRIVSEFVTDQGIVLSFNKPMNPVGASNLNNYSVRLVSSQPHNAFGDTLGLLGGFGNRTTVTVKSVRFQSAQYDPASQTVTLIPKQQNLNIASWPLQVHAAKTRVRPRHPLNVAQGLTDLQGNLINVDTTPGKVELVGKKFGYGASIIL